MNKFFGILICITAASIATFLASLQHFIGAPIVGLFLGVILSNVLRQDFVTHIKKGASFVSKYFLRFGIILAGGTLSFKVVVGVGFTTLPLIIFNIFFAFLTTLVVGKLLKIPKNTRILVGGGTAICGGTAIATLSPIVDANESETAFSLTSIFLFDIFAAILLPIFAFSIGFSPDQYGIFGGVAISDTSSVTAAGETFDILFGQISENQTLASNLAVIVKLTRTLMLIPLSLIVILIKSSNLEKNKEKSTSSASTLKSVVKAFPLFVIGFLLMAVANTLIGFSSITFFDFSLSQILSKSYKFFITSALVGVGFKIKLSSLFKEGVKPLILGGVTWAAVAFSSFIYVIFFVS